MSVYKSYLTCRLLTRPFRQIVITGGYYTDTGSEGNGADEGASNHLDIINLDTNTKTAGR